MDYLPIIISFFDQIDVFLLILVRVTAFFIFVPVVSGMAIPTQIRFVLAFFLSAAIFTSGLVTSATYHDSVVGLVMLMLHEFVAGAVMGFILFFIFNAILFAGQFMDFSVGFAMVNVIDPMQQIQVPILGNIMFMSVSALLVVNGGLHYFISAFANSYRIIPIGTVNFLGNGPLALQMLALLLGFITLAVQIAFPIVGALLIINVCLGIMVKTVPQMNVFVVGMPLKVLIGIFLMFSVMIPALGSIYNVVFDRAYDALIELIWGMSPYVR